MKTLIISHIFTALVFFFSNCSSSNPEQEVEEPVQDEEFSDVSDEVEAQLKGEEFVEETSAVQDETLGSNDDLAAEDMSLDEQANEYSVEEVSGAQDEVEAVASSQTDEMELSDNGAENIENYAEEVGEASDNGVSEEIQPENSEAMTKPPAESMAASNEVGAGVYVVRPGDTLARIAQNIYGDESQWKNLQSFNNLTNPNKIFPGDQLKFNVNDQSQKFANAYSEIAKNTVKVKKGDTLSKIAKNRLGSARSWRYLWAFNKTEISDPNRIEIGQVLWYLEMKSIDQMYTKNRAPKERELTSH